MPTIEGEGKMKYVIEFNDIAHPGDKDAQVYVTPEGKVARGYFNPDGDRFGYTSQFATCPNAGKHRRRK